MIDKKILNNCLLCYDAPCTNNCPNNIKPSDIIRSLLFDNYDGALKRINDSCINCDGQCMNSCISKNKVDIKNIMTKLNDEKKDINLKLESLRTDICGIEIENPFLLSSSVVASNYDMCKRALEAGWAGVSFKTISLIDMHEASPRFSSIKSNDGSFLAFKNIEQLNEHSVEDNLLIFKKIKKDFPNKFLLVSIMGRNEEEWAYLAKESAKAGADALELNFSCPNMTKEHTGSDVGQVPELVEKYTKAVVESVDIPVIAKLTPNVANILDSAIAAKRGGAKGVALINTIKSLTEFDIIKSLEDKNFNKKIAVGGLSGSAVKPVALRFVSDIAKNDELKDIHISAMGGIKTYNDAVMYIGLGATSLQVTTAVMEYGYRIIDDLKEGLALYLSKIGYTLKELKGSLLNNVLDIKDIKRDIVIYPKFNRSNCVGCGRCFISCMDGGHQAISFENRIPIIDTKKCVGCHLCLMVCPEGAIISSNIEVEKNRS